MGQLHRAFSARLHERRLRRLQWKTSRRRHHPQRNHQRPMGFLWMSAPLASRWGNLNISAVSLNRLMVCRLCRGRPSGGRLSPITARFIVQRRRLRLVVERDRFAAMATTATKPNDKDKIREHYDRISPYYRALWGEHIHHGYWIRGDESKETAQIQLIEHLAQAAAIPGGAKILDVGCGFGASSIYLARKYGAEATGITISQVQVEMA